MKTITFSRFSFLKAFVPLFLIFFSLNVSAQEIVTSDGTDYIKVDTKAHTSFSTALIISEFRGFKDSKVAISDEDGIVYVYPYQVDINTLTKRVKAILKTSDSLDLAYTNVQKERVISALTDEYGEWLMNYAHSGVRDNDNDSCHLSMPFCTGTIYTFPGGTGPGAGSPAQQGPNYNCLTTRPNPAWYHLKIENPGPIAIYMFSTPARDIDFCLWGPYADPITPCPMTNTNGGLTGAKVVDCSYSGNPTETANIPNGQTGQYYILVITNYSNQPCDITFQQSSGSGTTDCTILPPAATTNSPVCIGETIQFHAANAPGAIYNWSGPNNFISTLQNPSILNAQFIHGGVYSLTITVQGNTSDPTNTEVFVYDPPTGTLTANTPIDICQGDSVQMTITATSVGPYRAILNSGNGLPTPINFWQPSTTFWVHPTDTTTYSLTGISNNACSGTVSGVITVNVKPNPTPLFDASNPCTNLITQFTDQSVVSGASISAWDWNFGDLSAHATLQNPTHTYLSTNTYNVTLKVTSTVGCTSTAVFPTLISPTPTVNAGNDVSIAYGTITQLNGTSSGGSGVQSYLWEPSDKVVNATILNPNTIMLASTVDFSLTSNDLNGCSKSDSVTVTITGGPVSGVIIASPSEICIGDQTTLNAVPSGGSGFYSFTWTSSPAGFNSTLEDPTVNPTVTTTYYLEIYDNFNTTQAQKTIIVNQKPIVNAGVDKTIPHGTSTTLSSNVTGGATPYTYTWTPASVLVSPNAGTTLTHNLYGSTSFNLLVLDAKGCDQTDDMSVIISGGPLAVNPVALQPVICRNESTQLLSLPGGGSNQYVSYHWTSVPAGFTSTLADPTVSPTVTTTYSVVVDDGYNTISGTVTVTVNQLPVINLIPNDPKILVISGTEIGICVFDSIPIDAFNLDAAYLWSNGSTEPIITLSTSGISFDQQEYTVIVTDTTTGCSSTADLTAYFTFTNCSYGIEENSIDNRVKIYPNPSVSGIFNLTIDELNGPTKVEIYSAHGKLIYDKEYTISKGNTLREVLDLQTSPNGFYFLKLKNNEATLMKKLIIR